MNAFLDMGGYGVYVWSAYGIACVVLATLALASWRRGRRLHQKLQRKHQ
ncbi:MAG TPA: heme exporter protein CcmD [Gammaproteobacteria bacterium]|nr:heme exporter protein CcmD [Gammaproteobacteria bacterium]